MDGSPLQTAMLRIGGQMLRIGRQPGHPKGSTPLLLFNGIGGNIELLGPLAARMPDREVISFDVPGVGHSPLPRRPYRVGCIVDLAAGVLDHFGHARADVLGISWGGGPAQQFARSLPQRCRSLVLCATSTGSLMIPSRPSVALKMATPRRYMSKTFAEQVSGDIYGGDFRRDPQRVRELSQHVRWQSRLGYYLQIGAMLGWTSLHWLHRVQQPTLVMAGIDDPLVPLLNARLMHRLLPNAELQLYDCGHLFLLTRAEASARRINTFLDQHLPPETAT